ncbi:MAG: fibronectin type III domain-containing protein [Bacteroidales bacterium]|nr:fibronectin type III domain-containing protein [Bacteroidales bacterium]
MNTKRFVLVCILLSLILTEKSFSCTILYYAKDEIILAGNNEDWKDPATKMWIYPPETGKHGWIKFGFGSGFPQGGMNDQGVFWDATAGPHMDMPYSESNKTLYSGALMQKVIEESSNIGEAAAILQAFYCQDQYKAQYLIGDALGYSIISEGDSIIQNHQSYQVLTNFYQSNPDLGGYPCWRYDKAMELLKDCDKLTPYFIGSVLASTHQEGKYPTQYSNIYDLQNRTIYLFFYHNYDEFLFIDLQKEMEKGYKSYDIPSIFSKIELLVPDNGDIIAGHSVTISWNGLPDSDYRIIYSTNPDMSDSMSVEAHHMARYQTNYSTSLHIIPLIIFTLLILLKRNRAGLILVILSVALMSIHCENEESPEDNENTVEHTAILTDLESNTTYYWKIEAKNSNSDHFTTETTIQSFMTEDR